MEINSALPKSLLFISFCLMLAVFSFPQKLQAQTISPKPNIQAIKATPAYAELLLRKTELESDAESLLTSYTEDFPKIKESRFELDLIQKDLQTLLAQADTAKLTLALGKLLVRRAELATDLWALQTKFGNDHPEVKRAKKKVSVYDNAVKDILP